MPGGSQLSQSLRRPTVHAVGALFSTLLQAVQQPVLADPYIPLLMPLLRSVSFRGEGHSASQRQSRGRRGEYVEHALLGLG